MTINITKTDKNGNVPVWSNMGASGKAYYTFSFTDDDKFIMFPQQSNNPKSPKFIIKRIDSEKYDG